MTHLIVLAAAVTFLCAVLDFRTGKIPNWVTGPFIATGLLASAIVGAQHAGVDGALRGLCSSALGAMMCALVPALLYKKGAIGGGDVKLFIALGAICHTLVGLEVEMIAFMTGALLAPAKLAWEGKLGKTMWAASRMAFNLVLPSRLRTVVKNEEPAWYRLGPAIFVATAYVAYSHWRGS